MRKRRDLGEDDDWDCGRGEKRVELGGGNGLRWWWDDEEGDGEALVAAKEEVGEMESGGEVADVWPGDENQLYLVHFVELRCCRGGVKLNALNFCSIIALMFSFR